jgi:hypothetical protein
VPHVRLQRVLGMTAVYKKISSYRTVVPIFTIDESNIYHSFLGTGTFIDGGSFLVTARHVVEAGDSFTINLHPGVVPSGTSNVCRANLVIEDEELDLALLEVPEYSPGKEALELAQDDELACNELVVCFEYGTTQPRGKQFIMSPATRLGNVTRIFDLSEQYGRAGESMLELSFPALKGASGAPVFSNRTFHLWGIVVANKEYEALPVQITSVLDEKNQPIEQIRYMLPQGLAVHVKHVRALLERVRTA